MRLIIAILALFLPCNAITAAQLQYCPSFPVQHTSKLILDVQESLPLLNFSTKGNQIIKFDLMLKNGASKAPMTKLPLSLQLTLKDLFIFLKVNGEEIVFDPKGEKVSLPLMQFNQLIDKPVTFKIDTNGYLTDTTDVFPTVFKQLPALKDLSLELMLNEMFFYLFSLADQQLMIGAKIQQKIMQDYSQSLPAVITYEILDINEREILAKMEGKIEPKTFLLDTLLSIEGSVAPKVEMKLTGNTEGTISWNRQNALLYNMNNDYHYQAEMQFGDMRWTMQMKISNTSSTMPL